MAPFDRDTSECEVACQKAAGRSDDNQAVACHSRCWTELMNADVITKKKASPPERVHQAIGQPFTIQVPGEHHEGDNEPTPTQKAQADSEIRDARMQLRPCLDLIEGASASFDADFFARAKSADGDVPARIERCRVLLNQGRNALLDKDGSLQDLLQSLDKVQAEMAPRIAEEVACRASQKCTTARNAKAIAERLCAARERRAEALAGIAHERANPSGVVDLAILHALGVDVQDADEEIANASAEYLSLMHRPAVCK